MALTNAEKQRRFRARQRLLDRTPKIMYLTDDEAFYLERTLKSIREDEATPAMVRTSKGTLKAIDL